MADETPPLRDLFRANWGDDIPQILKELRVSSDRTAAIILVSMIQRNLERLLIRRISFGIEKLSESRKNLLFNKDGPFSTFSSIIDTCYALYMVKERMFKDLKAVKNIRNMFAHSALPITFEDPEIIAKIEDISREKRGKNWKEITLLKKLVGHRQQFTSACLALLEETAAIGENLDANRNAWLEKKMVWIGRE